MQHQEQQQQHSTTSRTKRRVLCLGDSHTRGRLGASWIDLLSQRLPQLQFINAGRDGEPSERILGRLPGLLRAHPDPAAVLVLSGSNDCIGQETAGLQQYYRWCFWLAQPLSQQAALSNADRMLQMLREQAPNAKVIVINLPILVEDPRHPANIRAHKYSRALCELVTQQHPHASMVDLQSACRAHMATHSPWKQALQELRQLQEITNSNNSSSPSAQAGPSSQWDLTLWNLLSSGLAAKWQTLVSGRSWNEVSRLRGLVLLTDQVHMNETAAWLLAGLVQPLLQDV